MRAQRIGLDVGRGRVRVVLLRRDAILWHDEERIDAEHPLDDAIAQLLRRAPVQRMMPLRVVAAIGPAAVQLKRLPTLPVAGDAGVLTDAVRMNAACFFLTSGAPLRTSAVHFRDGAWWAAAYDQSMLDAIDEGFRRAGWRLEGCIPLVSVLPHAYGPGRVCWRDGEAQAEVEIDADGNLRARRSRSTADGTENETTAQLHPPLGILGDDLGHSFAGAYAAALSNRRLQFFLRDGSCRAPERVARWRRLERNLALIAASCCVLAALLVPGILAQRTRARVARELRALATTNALVTRVDSELQRSTSALAEVARFVDSKRSMLQLLGSVSLALPESTAIASLRVDSVGGAFLLVSTAGPVLLTALARIDGFGDVQLAGAVTRETIGPLELNRLTVRFRHVRRKQPT